MAWFFVRLNYQIIYHSNPAHPLPCPSLSFSKNLAHFIRREWISGRDSPFRHLSKVGLIYSSWEKVPTCLRKSIKFWLTRIRPCYLYRWIRLNVQICNQIANLQFEWLCFWLQGPDIWFFKSAIKHFIIEVSHVLA